MSHKDLDAAKRIRFALVDVRKMRLQIIAKEVVHCSIRTLNNYFRQGLPEDAVKKVAKYLKIDPAWFYFSKGDFNEERFVEAIELGRTLKSAIRINQDSIENLKENLKQERSILTKVSSTGQTPIPHFDEKFFQLFQNHKIIKTFSDLAKVLGIEKGVPYLWRQSTKASNNPDETHYIPSTEFNLICTLFDINEKYLKAPEIDEFQNGILQPDMGQDKNIKKWQKLVENGDESLDVKVQQHMSKREFAQNVFLQTRSIVLVSDELIGFETVQTDSKIKLEVACPIDWSIMVLLRDERNEWFQITTEITASEASIHNGSIIVPQRGSLGVSSPGPNQFVVIQSKQPFPTSIGNTSLPIDSLIRNLMSFIIKSDEEEMIILKKSIFIEPSIT
jgi:hypothetical protein